MAEGVKGRRSAVAAAAVGNVVIATGAFWLSYTALADLAQRSGIAAGQAWLWPMLVDGLIVVATVAVVALDGHTTAWYAWALLIAGALVSVAANATHAILAADTSVPGLLAALVSAVPPLVEVATTHLLVVLMRFSRATGQREPGTDAEALNPAQDAHALITRPPRAERESPPEPPTRPVDPAPAGLALVVDEPSAQGEPAPRRLRAARLREKGWSNKQIAAELAVHPSTIGRWFTAADSDHPETDENTQEDPS